MSVLSRSNIMIIAGLLSIILVFFSGCATQDAQTDAPIVTATFVISSPTPSKIPPTPSPTKYPTATKTATRTPRPSATPTPTATKTSTASPQADTSTDKPSQTPGEASTRQPTITQNAAPTQIEEGRSPILTMGACNTDDRGYRWGPANVATRGGFESKVLLMTEWAPPECRPDETHPEYPPRALTVAECAIYYYKPVSLVLFPNRPFNSNAYYDDVAGLIYHVQSYEDEIGISRSKKIVIGPVSYEGGVIGSPNTVTALGAGVVDLPDIIQKTKDTTGFIAISDNVHLVPSAYFFGIVNTVVEKAIKGPGGVYTIEISEIPPYEP
ncbi:MAG: hypothetical protein JXB07_07010 [Anaerolineae bacterium]|nr:hypothetical protein [Anaerolineae bacterium]